MGLLCYNGLHEMVGDNIYRGRCRACKNERQRRYWIRHKDRLNAYCQNYNKTHREQISARRRNQWKNNKRYRIEMLLRRRLRRAVKGVWSRESMLLLGCSLEELLSHLESKWQNGMNWKNWGQWHIDHIQPLASFDLLDLEERKKAFHYTNLQPLWAKDNFAKGNRGRIHHEQ